MKSLVSGSLVVGFVCIFSVPVLSQGHSTDPRSADVDTSGLIDPMDLLVLSASWKAHTAPQYGDIDGNGNVGGEDLLSVLGAWHQTFPTITPTPTRTAPPTITPTPTITSSATPSPLPQSITIDIPGLPASARPMTLVRIPAGSFEMGTPEGFLSSTSEQPVHTVTFANDFYLGETEVSQAQWTALMGSNPVTRYGPPSYGAGNDYPVYEVSAFNIIPFLSALNALGQGTFRLPSEAEWEYACRGSAANPNRYAQFSYGDIASVTDLILCQTNGLSELYMWWCGNWERTTHPVASKLPNDYQLFDMHGNVAEWCGDRWHEDYTGAPSDGSAWEPNPHEPGVIRSGDGGFWAYSCRSAFRTPPIGDFDIITGVRIAMTSE